jgi:Flp pilus assembly protein protease CpaA
MDGSGMSDPSGAQDPVLPPSLRALKWLVIALTLTMIGGVITVVAVIVTRMPQALAGAPSLPEGFMLPEGAVAEAVTFGEGWVAVVTGDQRILIFGRDGRLRQEVRLTP